MNSSIRIASCLRREFASGKAGGRVVRIECRHHPINAKRGEEIWSADLDGSRSAESLAEEIAKVCDDDAEGIASGPQRYALFLYRENAPERALRGVVYMVTAPDAENDGEIETEPASKTGLTAMAMRHLEATQRMHVGSMAAVMGAMQRMLTTTTAENEKLRAERLESLTVVESLFSEQHKRDLETESAKARQQMLKDGAEKLMALAPMAIAHFTGKKSPELANAARIHALMADMTDDQKLKLFQLIGSDEFQAKDTQKIALGDLMQSINDGMDSEH